MLGLESLMIIFFLGNTTPGGPASHALMPLSLVFLFSNTNE